MTFFRKIYGLNSTFIYLDFLQDYMTVPLSTLRHSVAHLLAAAVMRLYPGAQLGIGPATEEGFYYDFGLSVTLTPEDLVSIADEMCKISAQKSPYVREV